MFKFFESTIISSNSSYNLRNLINFEFLSEKRKSIHCLAYKLILQFFNNKTYKCILASLLTEKNILQTFLCSNVEYLFIWIFNIKKIWIYNY